MASSPSLYIFPLLYCSDPDNRLQRPIRHLPLWPTPQIVGGGGQPC
ncbi:hypothetical protein GTCCBUS3UF5_18650 [Geobacillus thermoleovorans CCB_US3_UF5]|uniref:Uncharacterized protein n=1 Tax=Geobacillus thermoleovorans CCB_US3_UF5 TaxID=1111068 RepID=A0ABN4A0Y1_GEOTH|nr:hypothetical protein GTCCBUS3UF5_18650 [Geobacillus thermoleovorans CCB_US3_UF5]